MKVKYGIKGLETHTDERGGLVEMLKENDIEKPIKQINVITINPGFERGDHYHKEKFEWFFVARGNVELSLYNTETKEKQIIELSAEKPQVVNITPNIAHKFKNISKETAVLIYAINHVYNPSQTDTYPFKIT